MDKKLAGPIDLLVESWDVYKKNFITLLAVTFLPGIVSFALTLLGVGGAWWTIGAVGIVGVLIAILTIISIFLTLWGQISLVCAVHGSVAGKIGIVESFGQGWAKLRSFLWVVILTSAVVMGGFLLLVVPGIIFAVWFAFAYFVLVAEDVRGMNALFRSREYVRGRWWGVVWRFLVFGIIGILFFIIIAVLGRLLGESAGSVVTFLFSVLVGPMGMVYMYLLYKSLKETAGSFEFPPPAKTRKFFVAIAIFGALIVPLAIISAVVLVAVNPKAQLEKAREFQKLQQLQQQTPPLQYR